MPRGREWSRFILKIKEAKSVIQTAYIELKLHLSSSQRRDNKHPDWESAFSYLPDHLKMPKAKGKLNPAIREAHECLLCSKFRG